MVLTAKSSRRPHPVRGPRPLHDTNRLTEVPHLPRPALLCAPLCCLRSIFPFNLPSLHLSIRATTMLHSRLHPYRLITDKMAGREVGTVPLGRELVPESQSLGYPEPLSCSCSRHLRQTRAVTHHTPGEFLFRTGRLANALRAPPGTCSLWSSPAQALARAALGKKNYNS